jgi:hypothetical protein
MNTLEWLQWLQLTDGHVDGNAKMPMALQTQCNGRVKISGGECLAHGGDSRPVGRPQQTIRHAYIRTLKKLGFEEEGQLRNG